MWSSISGKWVCAEESSAHERNVLVCLLYAVSAPVGLFDFLISLCVCFKAWESHDCRRRLTQSMSTKASLCVTSSMSTATRGLASPRNKHTDCTCHNTCCNLSDETSVCLTKTEESSTGVHKERFRFSPVLCQKSGFILEWQQSWESAP